MNQDTAAGPEQALPEPDQRLDRMLAAQLMAPPLTDAFDRAVLARLDEFLRRERQSPADERLRAEQERRAALATLVATRRRSLGVALLDLAGGAALLWAGIRLAPQLADLAGRYAGALPGMPGAGHGSMPAIVTVLALAAAWSLVRARRSA